ncbi:hypothetical protein [Kitasatospora sp. NPDC047058]|uniref:hypothetical protein n=1 Tax=Kitasatospora sp. NPDC047058 TaxID=3155620 RepID=UPI0033E4F540
MPHCPHLAGRCTIAIPHWDHYGPAAAVPAPPVVGGAPIVDARLEQYDGDHPLLVLGWAGDTASLTGREALRLSVRVMRFAGRLVVLAIHLAQARRRG